MLLRIPQRPSLPIRNLLLLTNPLLGHALRDGGESEAAVVFEIGVFLFVYFLDVDEVGNLFDEFHVGQVLGELGDVAREARADDVGLGICEDLAKHLVQLFVFGEADHVDYEGLILTGDLQ